MSTFNTPQSKSPFTNPLKTQHSTVRDIPFFVTDNFLRSYYRSRSQLVRVERMVENAYEQYLLAECTKQQNYKKRLLSGARKERTAEGQNKLLQQANAFELSRCLELVDLYPKRKKTVKVF